MSDPKQRPIIFSGPMVRAILDGSKTQTRRVVKENPFADRVIFDPAIGWRFTGGPNISVSPYGTPGDRLWVRETFALESNFNVEHEDHYPPPHSDGRPVKRIADDDYGDYWQQPHYRATDPTPDLAYNDSNEPTCKWKPSIHMPRWASRLTLEVVDVRVERLNSITREGAIAEGIKLKPDVNSGIDYTVGKRFVELWNSINAKRGYSFKDSPWVWVIEFKRIDESC